jgi:hypothetical protein
MTDIIKPWDIYVGSSKIGTIQDAETDLDSPGSIEDTAEGPVGRTQGPVKSKISFNTVDVVGGRANINKLREALLGNLPIKVTQGPIGGKILTYSPCWVTNEKHRVDFKTRSATGSFSIEGVEPKITAG